MRRVEVAHCDVTDFSFLLQADEIERRLQHARYFIIPPVELHQIQAIAVHA